MERLCVKQVREIPKKEFSPWLLLAIERWGKIEVDHPEWYHWRDVEGSPFGRDRDLEEQRGNITLTLQLPFGEWLDGLEEGIWVALKDLADLAEALGWECCKEWERVVPGIWVEVEGHLVLSRLPLVGEKRWVDKLPELGGEKLGIQVDVHCYTPAELAREGFFEKEIWKRLIELDPESAVVDYLTAPSSSLLERLNSEDVELIVEACEEAQVGGADGRRALDWLRKYFKGKRTRNTKGPYVKRCAYCKGRLFTLKADGRLHRRCSELVRSNKEKLIREIEKRCQAPGRRGNPAEILRELVKKGLVDGEIYEPKASPKEIEGEIYRLVRKATHTKGVGDEGFS